MYASEMQTRSMCAGLTGRLVRRHRRGGFPRRPRCSRCCGPRGATSQSRVAISRSTRGCLRQLRCSACSRKLLGAFGHGRRRSTGEVALSARRTSVYGSATKGSPSSRRFIEAESDGSMARSADGLSSRSTGRSMLTRAGRPGLSVPTIHFVKWSGITTVTRFSQRTASGHCGSPTDCFSVIGASASQRCGRRSQMTSGATSSREPTPPSKNDGDLRTRERSGAERRPPEQEHRRVERGEGGAGWADDGGRRLSRQCGRRRSGGRRSAWSAAP